MGHVRPHVHRTSLVHSLRPGITSRDAWLAWWDTIPHGVRRILNRYGPAGNGRLLSFFSRVEGSIELGHDAPALAYLLAYADVFHPVTQPLHAARSLIRQQRRQSIGWLGFPGTESWVRIIRKIRPVGLTPPRLLYFQQAAHDPAVNKLLRHCPRINVGLLRIATDPTLRQHLSPQAAIEIGRHRGYDRRPTIAWTLKEILSMLGNQHSTWKATSRTHLYETHDALIKQTTQANIPISSTDCLEPLPGQHDTTATQQ
jgi:hypothetical protein